VLAVLAVLVAAAVLARVVVVGTGRPIAWRCSTESTTSSAKWQATS
jgi:Flp pilus assembly pilin Flp